MNLPFLLPLVLVIIMYLGFAATGGVVRRHGAATRA